MTTTEITDEAFLARVRTWADRPEVRRVMAVLREIFDDYDEDATDFQWLVVDAAAIVDHLHDDVHLPVPERVFAGLVDSARVDADDDPVAHQAAVQRIVASVAA